jgi:hypothetical protein
MNGIARAEPSGGSKRCRRQHHPIARYVLTPVDAFTIAARRELPNHQVQTLRKEDAL